MSHKPIVLWRPKATLASDDACTTILQYKLPPAPSTIPPPYQSPHDSGVKLLYVPSLTYFCIKALAEYPDEIHALGPARLRYEPPRSRSNFDILAALIPTYRPFSQDADSFDLSLVDPRLWAVLVQIYENLPAAFRQYTLPLSDLHLPLLQSIPSTQYFSLITVLALRSCRILTDDNVVELRHIHTLAALDASVTGLGTWGIQRLAKSLAWSEADAMHPAQRRGPWGLRILYLENCMNIDDNVLYWLVKFPLLSVVDLRGTTCKPWRRPDLAFKPCSDALLFDPTGLKEALDRLAKRQKAQLFSHPQPYILNVDSLQHKPRPERRFGHALNHLYDESQVRQSDHEWSDSEFGSPAPLGRRDVFLPYEPRLERREEQQSASALPTEPSSASFNRPMTARDAAESDEDMDWHNDPILGTQRDTSWLPPHWRLPEFGEGLRRRSPTPELQSDDEERCAMMGYVTKEVRRAYLEERELEQFYLEKKQRRRRTETKLYSIVSAVNPHALPAVSARQSEAGLQMLYRPPPPWSALPTSPKSKPTARPASPVASSLQAHEKPPLPLTPSTQSHATVPEPAHASASSRSRRGLPDSVFDAYPRQRPTPHPQMLGKRQRPAMEAAPVDQARKSVHALSSIQSMLSIVQKRAEEATKSDGTQKPRGDGGPYAVRGRANPFARTNSGSGAQLGERSLPVKRKTPPEPAVEGPTKAARKPEQAISTASSSKPKLQNGGTASKTAPAAVAGPSRNPATQPTDSNQAAPEASPLPTKKLKPITSLTVPDWPTAHHKPLSHHKPKQALANTAKTAKQTTLPVASNAEQPRAAREKGKRRMSAPVLKPAKLEMTKEERLAKPEGVSTNSSGKGAKKSGGFDWRGWSGE